jgi:uncharacterized membrane protein
MDEAIHAVRKESNMYWTISMILLMLWLLGLLTGYTMGGVIHVLPVIANVIVLFQVIQGVRITRDVAAIWAR